MSREILILLSIAIAICLFLIINNFEGIKNILRKIKSFKIMVILFDLLIIVIAALIIMKIVSKVIDVKNAFTTLETAKTNSKMFEYSDNCIKEEENFYKETIRKDYPENYLNPYIPDDFTYKEGEVLTGYVIEDKNENEFVWIPCSNKNVENVPMLERKNFTEINSDIYLSYNTTYNEKYKDFINSALQNGGFYISRYEMGVENGNEFVSKPNVEVASNYSKVEFDEKIEKMYSNIHSELINSYAYDTTLSWLLKNDGFEMKKYDKRDEDIKTGRSELNNIYDFVDNIMEMTQEVCYENRVIRGFGYDEDIQNWSRYSTMASEESYFDEYSIVGARSILYK